MSKDTSHLWTLLTHLHALAGPVLMLLYPLYASVQAIESMSKTDDDQWLAYWIIYSFLTLMEMLLQPILEWIPIWYDVKLILVAWLVLPQFKGAAFLYQRFVREKIKKYGVTDRHHRSPPNEKGKNKFMLLWFFFFPQRYASVQAIESTSKTDDDQWLAYWIIYSFLTLMEMRLQPILKWIPIWYDVKLILVAWLVLPQFKGAAFLYQRFVREKIKEYEVTDRLHRSPPNAKGKNNTKAKKAFLGMLKCLYKIAIGAVWLLGQCT